MRKQSLRSSVTDRIEPKTYFRQKGTRNKTSNEKQDNINKIPKKSRKFYE